MFKDQGLTGNEPASSVAVYEVKGETLFQLDTGEGFFRIYMDLTGGESSTGYLRFTQRGAEIATGYTESQIFGSGQSSSNNFISMYGYSSGIDTIASMDVHITKDKCSAVVAGKGSTAFTSGGYLLQGADGILIRLPEGRHGTIIVEKYNV